MERTSPIFLTIIETKNSYTNQKYYRVCFVNSSKLTIHNLTYSSSGSVSLYGNTAQVTAEERTIGDLHSDYVVEIEQIEQYGFTKQLQYDFYGEMNSEKVRFTFVIPKDLNGTVHSFQELPVIQERGMIFIPIT